VLFEKLRTRRKKNEDEDEEEKKAATCSTTTRLEVKGREMKTNKLEGRGTK